MALTNGMKYFSILLLFIFVSSCNREETNPTFYFKVKNPKDYTDLEYHFEALTREKLNFSVIPWQLSNLTFYDRNFHLIRRAKIEEEDLFGRYIRAYIQNGKIHGFLRVYEKEEKPFFLLGGVYKVIEDTEVEVDAENLQLKEEYCFHNGIMHGPYREFEKGHLTKAGRYYFGHKIGAEKEYSTSGVLRRIVQYQDGHEVSEKKYYENGQLNSLVLYGHSFFTYDHNKIPVHRETYNYDGLLVEEFNRRGVSKIYDYDSKNYRTYKIDAEGHFKGSYYCAFDENGRIKYAIDMSKFKNGTLLLKSSNLNMQFKIADGKLDNVMVERNIGESKYVYDNKKSGVNKYLANKLVGIYFPESKVIRGEIDPQEAVETIDTAVFDTNDREGIRRLLRDLEKGQADIDDFENLLKRLYEGR